MFGLDVFAAVEVGDGARHFQYAVVGAGAHVELGHGFFQVRQALAVDGAILSEHGRGHLGIAMNLRVVGKAAALNVATQSVIHILIIRLDGVEVG